MPIRLLLICPLLLPLWVLNAQAPVPPPVTSPLEVQFTLPDGWTVRHLAEADFLIAASDPVMLTARLDLPPNTDNAVRVLIFGVDQVARFGSTPEEVLTAYTSVLDTTDRLAPYAIRLPDGRIAQRIDYANDFSVGFVLSFPLRSNGVGLIVTQSGDEFARVTQAVAVYQLSASIRSIDCSGVGWIVHRACVMG